MNQINKGNNSAGNINIALGLLSNNSMDKSFNVKKEDSLFGYFIFLTIIVAIMSYFGFFYQL